MANKSFKMKLKVYLIYQENIYLLFFFLAPHLAIDVFNIIIWYPLYIACYFTQLVFVYHKYSVNKTFRDRLNATKVVRVVEEPEAGESQASTMYLWRILYSQVSILSRSSSAKYKND